MNPVYLLLIFTVLAATLLSLTDAWIQWAEHKRSTDRRRPMPAGDPSRTIPNSLRRTANSRACSTQPATVRRERVPVQEQTC